MTLWRNLIASLEESSKIVGTREPREAYFASFKVGR